MIALKQSESKISSMEKETSELKDEIRKFKSTYYYHALAESSKKIAYLTPGDSGYAAIQFDLGVLTVGLTDIKTYANGSKITLKIGNTLSADIDGLTGSFEWGKLDADSLPDEANSKYKDVTFNETLRAGSWNTVTVILEGVPPAEFGYLKLNNFSHSGIKLKQQI